MKRFQVYLRFLLVFGVLLQVSGAMAQEKWLGVLEKDPANQQALQELAGFYKIPVALVSTKVLAEKISLKLGEVLKNEKSTFYLVGLYEYLGEYGTARSIVSKFMDLNPGHLRSIMTIGWEWYLEKKYDEALTSYNEAIEKDPKSLDALHGKMLVLMTRGSKEEAKALGTVILKKDPKNLVAALRMGNLAYEEKQYNAAISYYQLVPQNIDCKLGLGLCYAQLKSFDTARPLLLEAYKAYPANPNLIEALGSLNEEEIKSLEKELAGKSAAEKSVAKEKGDRLIQLYELNGHFDKAATCLLEKTPQKDMTFDQMVRVAAALFRAGRFEESGQHYKLAAASSPNPRITKLAAIDAFFAAKKYDRVDSLLQELQAQKPGLDLDTRFASLYVLSGRKDLAKETFEKLGKKYEGMVPGSPEPRGLSLVAVDAYLNGKFYDKAATLLNDLAKKGPAYDLDLRYARMYFEQKSYSKAIEIYKKYPKDLPMQISRGWSLVAMSNFGEAREVFESILAHYPKSPEAKAGYRFANDFRAWDIFLIGTSMTYGNYQDDRRLLTEMLRFSHKKAITTLSHTRTDVVGLTPGKTDLNEDLYGAKVYYQFNTKNAVQVHAMGFQNDDPSSDNSSIVGVAYFHFPEPRLVLGLEFDKSSYPHVRSSQFSPFAGYKLNDKLRLDLRGVFTDINGTDLRKSQPSNTSAVKGTFTYLPHKKLALTFSGWTGTRRLEADSAGMFAFNILDGYTTTWALGGSYKLSPLCKLFLSYSASNFESEWQAAANELAGGTFNPDQTVRVLSFGVDYFF